MGILACRRAAARTFQKVKQGIEAEKAQQNSVDAADEQFGKQRVGVIQALVDGPADEGSHNRSAQKCNGQFA